MTSTYRIEALDARHDRQGFACGVAALDRYLREVAGQDVRRLVSKCFVACPAETITVCGFYTLAAAETPVGLLPEELSRKVPRYPTVPVIRLGRLAVDRRLRGQGLGTTLIADAVRRVLRSEIGAFALTVDAKDGSVAAFYKRSGFLETGTDRVLALPLATARKWLGRADAEA